MHSRKRDSKSTISKGAKLDAPHVMCFDKNGRNRGDKSHLQLGDGDLGQSNSSRSNREPKNHVSSLRPTRKHTPDGAVGDDCGRFASFHENSNSALAPFEAAVKKSRGAFVEKLDEYHATLYCAANSGADIDQLEEFIDEAVFAAHRIAGVGKTLGFPELGEAARRTETAIVAYKQEFGSVELRSVFYLRICQLASIIEAICADHDECLD